MLNKMKKAFGNDDYHKRIRKSFASCIVVLIALIFATIAWFASSRTLSIKGINLGAVDTGDVQIGLNENDWQTDTAFDIGVSNVDELETATEVGVKEPVFENIYGEDDKGTVALITKEDSKIMAPGTYGFFTFYVRTTSPSTKSCKINLTKVLKGSDLSNNTELKNELENLFTGHILCFSNRTKSDEGYLYSGLIDDTNSMTVAFESSDSQTEGKIQKVTIYWVWPYEFKDLVNTDVSKGDAFVKSIVNSNATSDEIKAMTGLYPARTELNENAIPNLEGYPLTYENVYEIGRYKETKATFSSSDNLTKDSMLTEWYDYADTLMASYINNLKFHISVEGAN